MRYIKLPFFWEDEEGDIAQSEVYVNPFHIDSFHGTLLEYEDEDGNITETDVSIITMRNSMSYQIMMDVKSLQKAIQQFMAQ